MVTEPAATYRTEPDLAARQAVIAAIGWLLIAAFVGVASQAVLMFPSVTGSFSFLSHARLATIFDGIFLFGFLGTAFFAVAYGVIPRAVGAQLHNEILGATCVIWWNLLVLFGSALLVVGIRQTRPLAEFHVVIDLALVILLLVTAYNLAVTSARRNEKRLYLSVWYILVASFALPVIIAVGNLPSGSTDALVSAFYQGGLEFLWLTPVALGLAYFVVPLLTGNPLYSVRLGRIGLWSLLTVGGWTGLRYLVLGAGPKYLAAIGTAMMIAALVPILSSVTNLFATFNRRWDAIGPSMSLRFTAVGLAGLVAWTFLSVASSFPDVAAVTSLTSWTRGMGLFAWMFVFSSFGLAAIYFIFPLVSGRHWFSARASAFHFWTTLLGAAVTAGTTMIGGLVDGTTALTLKRLGLGVALDKALDESIVASIEWQFVILTGLIIFVAGQVALVWNAYRTAREGSPMSLTETVNA